VKPLIRYALGGLLALVALNAAGGGWYGLSGAEGIPTEWLRGSPFRTYVGPSLILLLVVGGSSLAAAIAVLLRRPSAVVLATSAGVILLGWIAVQLTILGYVSWMQPAAAAAGVIILALTGAGWWRSSFGTHHPSTSGTR
jgi:hypothetical protein